MSVGAGHMYGDVVKSSCINILRCPAVFRPSCFGATVTTNGSPYATERCLSCLSACNVGVCCQTIGWIKMLLGTKVGLDPGDVLLDGDPAPPPKRGAPPKFSAHVYCGQTAGWMKLVLGMEVGLNPGDFVLDGTQSPSRKGDRAPLPNFRPISIVAKRLDASKCHLVWMFASAQGTLC